MKVAAQLKWVIGLVFFLLAFFLRTSGLSHDLHLDRIYHPDTPKQIRAVERFLQGDYYTVIGGRDYEGYPLFNSHLVEYLIRAYQFAGGLISGHLGLSGQIEQPAYLAIFWITRLLNATLSASAVWLVYLIGWRWFAPSAGIIAALLLTFSPVDITACHYANGDTAAAFFALLGVYLALRLLERPSLPLYFLAGLVAAAAFSSKYHGGIALGTAGLAHLFHYAKARRPFSAASIGRGFLLLISFIIGLFLTSPALIVYTDGAFDDIVQFFEYTASFGMTAEMREMSTWERFRMGMSVNMPVLQDVVGMIPAIAALLALIAGFLRAPVWIIASLPLVYILAGLATKPLTHAVYHTMATPGIMLLAGFSLFWLQSAKRIVWPRRIIVMALTVIATGYLAAYAHRELFFFRHNDTRYLAESWARDNIPPSFKLNASPYTFDGIAWHTDPASKPEGEAYVFSGRTGINPPADAIPLHTFNIEHEKLVVFRNWPQHLFLANSPFVSSKGPRPGFQPLPSPHPLNLIDADAPWWVRHSATWYLAKGERKQGSLTSTNVIAEAAWYIRNQSGTSDLMLEFGGNRQRIKLDPLESLILPLESFKAATPVRVDGHFYSWSMHARFGSARVSLLTSARDMAWAHFNCGNFAEVLKALERTPDAALKSGERLIREISQLSQNLPTTPSPPSGENILDDYGLSPDYIARLPGTNWETNAWESLFITNRQSGAYLLSEVHVPEISLEAGMYILELDAQTEGSRVELVLLNALDQPVETRVIDMVAPTGAVEEIIFAVDQSDSVLRPRIRYDTRQSRLVVNAIAIRPDIDATLKSYGHLLDYASGLDAGASQKAERFWYSHLMMRANQHVRAGNTEQARALYITAISASPHRREALKQFLELPGDEASLPDHLTFLATMHRNSAPFHTTNPFNARFDSGTEMTGYQITKTRVKPGEAIGILVHLNAEEVNRDINRQEVWFHLIAQGQSSLLADGYMSMTNVLMAMRLNMDRSLPWMGTLMVPSNTPPGEYMLNAGLWIPSQRRRVKVTNADIPHTRRNLMLTRIDVLE